MPDAENQRKAVGVYDRPHPLTRPRVWIPIAIAVVVAVAWYFILY